MMPCESLDHEALWTESAVHPIVVASHLASHKVRVHQHPNPAVRLLRILLVALGVTLDVVRRLEADENQLLSRERTDEQPTDEVKVLMTAPTHAPAQNPLLFTVVVFHFHILLDVGGWLRLRN